MNKLNLYSITILIMFRVVPHQTAIIQNPKLSNTNDGFLELKPNGSVILSNRLNSSDGVWQEALIFKNILNAIRSSPLQTKNTLKNDLNEKIYGDGVEHKFPPFLERVIQRIQTYFSIYKYTDTSKPVTFDNKTTTAALTTITSGILNETLNLDQNEIDVNLSSDNSIYNTTHTTSLNVNAFSTEALKATTTTKSTAVHDEDEDNEFIEIKS